MSNQRYLTKSRFKLGLSCPTKLFYTKKSEYSDNSSDDDFLKALARGGFQVGELAKCYYPDGVEVIGDHGDYEGLVAKTEKLLQQENVTIFEAAIRYEDLFIRIDILEKKGNKLKLIEVKSKSVDPTTFQDEIWHVAKLKKDEHQLKKDWHQYIYDVAFQSHVLKNARPEFEVSNFLMCADKSVTTSINGLNQKFQLKKDENGRDFAIPVGDVSPSALGSEVLTLIALDEIIAVIHGEKEMSERFTGLGFKGGIKFLSDNYKADTKIKPVVSSKCKNCEFRSHEEGKKSGFYECWLASTTLKAKDLEKPFVFDVWNWRGHQKLIDAGTYLMENMEEEDIGPTTTKSPDGGISNSERQWLQVERVKEINTKTYYCEKDLKLMLDKFIYPLNMIDFETSMVAIPFNEGRRPYEQIAFQFSHHTIEKNGTITHKNQFINTVPGVFPNFEFVRALKAALSENEGSIFRYSNHENTVLGQILTQLENTDEAEVADKDELIEWIKTITIKKTKSGKITRVGERNMLDLLEMVKKFYYAPSMGGSNSIKAVLPAILNESTYLKEKYSKEIYGKGLEINSLNLEATSWVKMDGDKVIDPYKSLPELFSEYDYETLDLITGDKNLADGGAAMTAYAMMQFSQMSDTERLRIKEGLLRYCELDTMAMVFIFEAWREELSL